MTRTFKIFSGYKSLRFYGLFVLILFFMISACATPPKPSRVTATRSTHSSAVKSAFDDVEIEKRLRQEYHRWRGTQHRLGGTGSRGIDCSGFVQAVYRDVFNVDLPRTTSTQAKQGKSVAFDDLRAGDLVFFKPPTYPHHVGIYLSDSKFVHASKTKGVTLSKIDRTYWKKYYWTARRILPVAGHSLNQ
jgi:cell wall-associated NlpC family hydrolase